jgi:hypothetical protein
VKKHIGLMLLAVHSFSALAGTLIDDGIVAKNKQFSSVVKIGYYQVNGKKETNVGHCTGTLIAQDIVLTAAHCVNTDKNVIQRVSLSGDSSGFSDERVVTGGIKVKQSFKSSNYDLAKYQAQLNSLAMQTEEFERLAPADKEEFQIKAFIMQKLVSAYDIAFLQLERPQVMLISNLSSLGCKTSLKAGDEIAIAGYGLKSVKEAKENSNPNYVLNYGYNKVDASPLLDLVYTISKAEGKQLVNSGDSGGPIFKKTNQKIVYGVTSTKSLNDKEINLMSTFGSLSSKPAKEIYKQISTNALAPKNLQDIAKNCL